MLVPASDSRLSANHAVDLFKINRTSFDLEHFEGQMLHVCTCVESVCLEQENILFLLIVIGKFQVNIFLKSVISVVVFISLVPSNDQS